MTKRDYVCWHVNLSQAICTIERNTRWWCDTVTLIHTVTSRHTELIHSLTASQAVTHSRFCPTGVSDGSSHWLPQAVSRFVVSTSVTHIHTPLTWLTLFDPHTSSKFDGWAETTPACLAPLVTKGTTANRQRERDSERVREICAREQMINRLYCIQIIYSSVQTSYQIHLT